MNVKVLNWCVMVGGGGYVSDYSLAACKDFLESRERISQNV